jgi:hypothetical protein
MKKSCNGLCISVALVLSLLVSSASALDKDHGNGKSHNKHADQDRDRDHDGDKDHDRHGPSSRPAGWDKGKKTGWGNCDVPPGQAKKVGCNPGNTAHHADHVKHSDHDARLHRDAQKRTFATHKTGDTHRATHPETHHDVKPAPTANNQAAPAKGGSRVEHPRTAAVQK